MQIIDFGKDRYTIQHYEVPYDVKELLGLYEDLNVWERNFICKTFIGKELGRVTFDSRGRISLGKIIWRTDM
jgi:hypothetical protein